LPLSGHVTPLADRACRDSRGPYGRAHDNALGGREVKRSEPRRRLFVRDFLVLLVGNEFLVWGIAIWLTGASLGLRTCLLVSAIAAALSALGLFMTWDDPGPRVWNAAKTLLVLLTFVAVLVALIAWTAHASGGHDR
jgi:hypothetical protein